MIKITAEEIRALREETGEGMMECKRRLTIRKTREAINTLPFTSVEQKEVLGIMLDLIENKHPADRY